MNNEYETMKPGGTIYPRSVAVFLVLALLVLLGAGAWYFRSQEQLMRRQVEENMLSIARSKANQIADWRQERLTDAALVMNRSDLIHDAETFLATSTDFGAVDIRRTLTEILSLKKYSGIMLTTTQGRERLAVGDTLSMSIHREGVSALATALAERKPVFADLHSGGDDSRPHLAVVAPLFSEGKTSGAVIGTIVFVFDPAQYLYPLIQSWPIPSKSGETLLVRRDGDQVVFLNNPRHHPNAALKLRFPLTRSDIPAVMTVLGYRDIVYCNDYRGIAVVSALVPIIDSPWFMVAKIDAAEAFSTWRFQAAMIIFLMLTLTATIGALFIVAQQRAKKTHFLKLYKAERRLRASIEKQAVTLQSIGDAVIATDADGKVELMNVVAENLTGWREIEAQGLPLSTVFQIISEESREPIEDPVSLVLKKNKVIGLANHTLLIAKDGRETAIADSGAPIRGENGEITGIVLVFRDQTKERLAQRLNHTRLDLIEYALTHSMDELLTRTLDTLGEMVQSPVGFYHLVDPDQKTISLQHWSTKTLREFYRVDGKGMHCDIEQAGVWAECVYKKKPVIHNDYPTIVRKKGIAGGHVSVVRDLLVPVVRGNRIVAILGVGNKPADYNEKDVEIVSYLADVTWEIVRQMQVADILRESERRYRALLSNLPGMAYRCQTDNDWTMELVSDGVVSLTGYQVDELVGNAMISYANIIHQEDRQRVWDEVQVSLQKHRSFELNYRIITAGGEEKSVWEQGTGVFDPQGNLLALEGFIIDVTGRKKAEAEKERLLLAVEQTAEAIIITDASGIILYVNRAFEQTTGYSRVEAIGLSPRILKSGEQDMVFYENLWQTITDGQTWEGRLINRRKDGSLYTEEATISPIWDDSGKICNYVAVKRDITEHLRLSQQFQQAQKMESVARLAGGVAHDFNNMLGVILGFTELALNKTDPADALHSDLEEIFKAAKRSADITKQLLAFARKQIISPQVLELNDIVDGMLKMLRRLIGEDIDLVWRPASTLWQVKLDPAQIDQILANLCVNARDAIEGVGKVTLETHNVVFDAEYCADHVGFLPGRFVLLAVSDNGGGMDQEILKKIFEPFFTTKEIGQGTGLGLATVFGIVKQNKGFVNVYSEPGKGTTFKLYFPACTGEALKEPEQVREEIPRGGGDTVLVVEDETSILRLTEKILTGLDYRVLTAESPFEALRLIEAHADAIVLLITDVVMPEMNGRELARRAQMYCPQLKCLFMSGYTANVIAHHGVLDEGAHFIQKPFSAKNLGSKIKEAMR